MYTRHAHAAPIVSSNANVLKKDVIDRILSTAVNDLKL